MTTDYYHGKLDRRTAEERLSSIKTVGSFLVRESDRKSGSFVLSYYGRSGVINHFRITHAYGAYFIGGRQFDSLVDLVDYYTSTCDILTDERLLYPISPPEPVTSGRDRLFISILPYTKLALSDELSFKKGDLFILQNDLGDNWFWMRDVRTGQSGMVFSHLVEEIQEDMDPNEVFPWFHAHLSKADAVNKLANAGPGSFLVRPSDNSPGNYTLFYHVGTTVQRFLILKNSDNRFSMGGKCFDSLGQLIELYQEEQIIEGHVLQFPVMTTMSRADQLSKTLSTSMKALKTLEKPQEVYLTVKISREAAERKQCNEIKGWLSLKKGNLQKKWKRYFFVLNSRDRHLYYYEKPQQTKPKGLIDLSYSYFYKVHESLLEWPQCFQLIEKCLPCFANQFYMRCDDEHKQYERWINSIRKFTTPNQSNITNVSALVESSQEVYANAQATRKSGESSLEGNSLEVVRSVYLCFLEAHSIKVNQPYFAISFNRDIKVAKTQVKTAPTTIFSDNGYFAFEDLPADIKSITVSIHHASKKPKAAAVELAQFSSELSTLNSDNHQLDHWFELTSLHSPDILGYLRLKIDFSHDIVMGLPEYAAFEHILCDTSTELLTLLDQYCYRDRLTLARALANIYRYKRTSTRILKYLIEREVSLETETAKLFRASSLTTALFESYMRCMCQSALNKCLKSSVKKLMDDKICCELNPSKVESHNVSQKACDNLQNLLDLLDELVGNIYNSMNYYPISVRYLFACLADLVEHKWPKEPLVRTRAVSGFLFLRLICPTLLNPKQFNVVQETPDENALRNLTLVAKCLQNLANLVETPKSDILLAQSILTTLDDYAIYPLSQNQQTDQADYSAQTNSILTFILSPQIESWMEVVNPFILKNKIGLIKFVDELCNVEFSDSIIAEKPAVDGNNNVETLVTGETMDIARDLATVHNICERYQVQFEQLSASSPGAKKLSTTLTILSRRKQLYASLLNQMNARKNFSTTLA